MSDAVDQFESTEILSSEGQKPDRHDQKITSAMAKISAFCDHAFRWASDNRQRLKPITTIVALGLFCIGLFLSLRVSPDIWVRIEIAPLLIILLVTLPIGLAISAADFQMMARLTGVKVGFWSGAEIALYSRAANMLPIPGSFAVRMTVLKAQGATFKRSGGLMFLFTAIWGGVGFCFSAAWLVMQAPLILTLIFAGTGLAILTACALAVYRTRLDWRIVSYAAGLRLSLIILEAFALMLAVKAIGVDAAYHQTAILVVASFLAGIVPAGIGVRETILAMLAPIAGIDPAAGFLAGVVARMTGMAFLAICTAIVLFINRWRS